MKATKARHGRRYTTEELRTLMEMWASGSSRREIADALGTTEFAIHKQVTRMRSQGIPLSRRAGGGRLGRTGKPWTQEEVEYLFRRRLLGVTAEEIAADLGRTVCGVHGMIGKLRSESVPIAMLGQGPKRFWDSTALKAAAVGRFSAEEVQEGQEMAN